MMHHIQSQELLSKLLCRKGELLAVLSFTFEIITTATPTIPYLYNNPPVTAGCLTLRIRNGGLHV